MNTTLIQFVMLALVASIHVLNTNSTDEYVDGRDKPDHDGESRRAAYEDFFLRRSSTNLFSSMIGS